MYFGTCKIAPFVDGVLALLTVNIIYRYVITGTRRVTCLLEALYIDTLVGCDCDCIRGQFQVFTSDLIFIQGII